MNSQCTSCGHRIHAGGGAVCVACRLTRGLASAGELYATFLAGSADRHPAHFDAFCAAHPDHSEELRRLHRIACLNRGATTDEAVAKPAVGVETAPDPSTPEVTCWPAGSRYQIEGMIARGGMGVVFSARDRELDRVVAMKVIGVNTSKETPLSMDEIPSSWVDRFIEEAHVVARLDHPNIVPIHEIGLDPLGRLYFTMKLVKGRHLGEIFRLARARQEGWNLARAIRTLTQATQAVAHAHEQRVIHRDLKPHNIMVGRLGEVFVMDWGVARSKERNHPQEQHPAAVASVSPEDSPILTHDGTVLGTPAYMSPEQAWGHKDAVGPHSDVYSLGAVLYELLAGHPPFFSPDTTPTSRQVLEALRAGPPKTIASLATDQPAELVAICTKAMARQPEARYRTASELAEDLQAWLDRRVVRAYRTGALAELRAWIGRNRLAAFSQAAAVVLIITGLLATVALQRQANRRIADGADLLQQANRDLRGSLYRMHIARATEALQRGDGQAAKNALESCDRDTRGWEWDYLRQQLPQLVAVPPPTGPADVVRAVLSRDGRWIAGIDWGGTLRVWSTRDGTLRNPPTPLDVAPYSLALHPNQTTVAIGSTNGTLCLRDLSTPTNRWATHAHTLRVASLAFSPDGSRLLSGGADGVVCLWDTATGQRLKQTVYGGYLHVVRFSPDGATVLLCNLESSARLLDAGSLETLRTFESTEAGHTQAAFSPDGRRVAIGDKQGIVRVWHSDTGLPTSDFQDFSSSVPIYGLDWSPDGARIAAGSSGNTVWVLEANTGHVEQILRENSHGWLPSLQFSSDSTRLLASGLKGDTALRLWNLDRQPRVIQVEAHTNWVWSAAFTPDNRQLVTAGFDGTLALSDARSGRVLRTFHGHTNSVIWSVAVTPDGRQAVSGGQDGTVRVWNLEDGTEHRVWRAQPYPSVDNNVTLFVAINPNGTRVAAGGFDGRVQVWELSSGNRLWGTNAHDQRLWSVAWSPDGQRLVAGGYNGWLTLWDAERGVVLWQTNAMTGAIGTVAFRPDGRAILTSHWSRELRLWDPESGQLQRRIDTREWLTRSAAFSPDGRRVVSAGHDGIVRIWDPISGELMMEMPREPKRINFVAFSPDGRCLVTGNEDHIARIWLTVDEPEADTK